MLGSDYQKYYALKKKPGKTVNIQDLFPMGSSNTAEILTTLAKF